MSSNSSSVNKRAANTDASSAAENLIGEAKKLTAHGFAIIPLNDRIPIIAYTKRRRQLASISEINIWFSNGNGRAPKANGIGIALNDTEFGIDTDGKECESIFLKKIRAFSPELQNRILNTMHTKTPHGHHRTYKYVADDFPDGIEEKTFFRLNDGHSEIALKGKNHLLFERGPGYEILNGVDNIVSLTKTEVNEFLGVLQRFSIDEWALNNVVKKLVPYFVKPHRNDIIFSISGYLHKSKTPLNTAIEIARRLIDTTGYNDENPSKIFRTIKGTYAKDRNSDKVSGYNRLREVLKQAVLSDASNKIDSDVLVLEIISTIEQTLKRAGLFEISYKEHQQAQDELLREGFSASSEYKTEGYRKTPELAGINDDILMQLAPHVHSVISINPPVLYIADKYEKYIVRARISFDTDSETTEESKNAKGQSQKIITRQQKLNLKDKIILAIPNRVVINNDLLTDTRTYTITFVSKIDNRPLKIGPGSIDYILSELDNRNKILKKLDASEALRAILNRYEEKKLAEVTESVTQPGYFYLKGKFITHEITQKIDKTPDKNHVRSCTELLDELSNKWQNPDIFPSVIKWFTLAPFGCIFKSNNNRWLPNFHDHGWSSTGKTSLGKIGLAIWRLHTNALRKDYQLGFGNIDNTARLGFVISKSTYPKVINEVGALRAKYNRPLVEAIKQQIESLFVRGKYSEGRYQNIPALCSLFLTSNSKAPDDSGYRSRTTIIHHTRDEVHDRNEPEAKEFEEWLESNLNTLGVLGDFIAWYAITKPEKPEQSVLLSGKSYNKMSTEIIEEFYRFANKDKPEWLDRNYEQKSILEENSEQAYFEIRSFLMNQINEAYTRHMRVINPENTGIAITFEMRLHHCLRNKVIPYLHEHIRHDGTKEIRQIRITHDMLTELHKKAEHLEGVTTMEDLAKELPNFTYTVAKIGAKPYRILIGGYRDFVNFLEGEINES